MYKLFFGAAFALVPMMAFASGSATSSRAPVAVQAATCTAHDLLVQKIDNAYGAQFPTNCDPVSTWITRIFASRNDDAISRLRTR
jgi:hypothetical protein